MSTNTPEGDGSSSSKEVDPCTHLIVEKINPIIEIMKQLIKQQEKIIELIQPIAPNKKETTSTEETSTGATTQLSDETRVRRLKLYRAALSGDWEVAKRIYDVHKDDVGVKISEHNESTALHIAAAAKHVDFVRELVSKMNENDLQWKDRVGNTALFFAAASRKVELAQEMMKKDKSIALVPDENDTLPIHMAASIGDEHMVEYLYEETRHSLSENQRIELFISLVEADLYGFAEKLLIDYPDLAIARPNEERETALHVLARKHLSLSNFADQNQKGIFKRLLNLGCFGFTNQIKVAGAKNAKIAKLMQLVERIWERVVRLSYSEITNLIAEPWKLLFDAAERGNVGFLFILICKYPDLIWKISNKENYYTIFHIAVKHRQGNVFKLIYEIGTNKKILLMFKDQKENNILHLAGFLPKQVELNTVSGAALQMQQELLWFKRVEGLVQPKFVEARNKKGFTPRELFTQQHEGLRAKGEKWMKDTATSCLVVAALIATVAFAAAITVPGGNNQDTGFPIFLDKFSFKIFAIADAVSLVSSATSIMDFLSILTSRYAEKDFLWMLPTKLLIGLGTLFVSIAAMMVVFSTTFFIFFNDTRLWIPILVTVIASIPVIVFIWQHIRLLCDVLRSTCCSNSFLKKGKKRLFPKEEEETCQRRQNKTLKAYLKFQCTCSTNV